MTEELFFTIGMVLAIVFLPFATVWVANQAQDREELGAYVFLAIRGAVLTFIAWPLAILAGVIYLICVRTVDRKKN